MKVSDFVVNFFLKNGIDVCFTVTGGGAMHLNDSFGHNKKIKSIYNHHEQACAMAAEGYTRVSGKPAVVCVTSGPATTNTLTGVLGAWLDSIPMIVLSGQMSLNTMVISTPIPLRQLGFQEYNIIDSVKHMTKYAETITDAKYIAYHLEKALFLCQEGRKGPVWLDIPLDIQSSIVDIESLIHFDFNKGEPSNFLEKRINSNLTDVIFDKLNKSIKPVIFAGYGIRMSNSYNEFLSFANKLQIPVVTEWNSNDLICNNHEFFAGRPSTIGDRGGNFVVQNSDLIIAIGCQFTIRQISYAWKNFAKNAYIIAVDVDRNELLKPTLKIDFPIECDIKLFLTEIYKSKNESIHNTQSKWFKWCKQINNKYPVFQNKHLQDISPISVYAFIHNLSNKLKEDDTVVLANGAACVVGLQASNLKQGQRIFTNAGASSMGYAICASIGASIANDKRIICIEGDGSIQMNLQELQTIIHNKLNIKIFWINNDGYHSIKQTQNTIFDAKNKGFCGANKQSGISFPSAEKIANAYEIKYFKIDKIDSFDIIDSVLNFYGPTICEVVTNPNEIFEPKLQSKLLPDGKFYTPSLEDMAPFLPEEEMKNNIFENK